VSAPVPTPGPQWDGLVVLCAANGWDDVKLADRHMAERLAAHAPVLYVDPPISHLTRLRNPGPASSLERPRLRLVAPGIARLATVAPPKPMHPAVLPVTNRWVRHQLARAVRRLGGGAHAVISTWLFVDAYGVCGERRRVYWWQDDPAGAAELWGRSAERVAARDERLASASDLVVAVNEEVARGWQERGFAAEFLPNGCDASFYADADDVAADAGAVDLDGPVAGLVGHINARTDLALLDATADAGVSLLLIGPKDPGFEPERFERLTSRAGVSYLGPVPFEELRPYLGLIDVGLVPYADTPFNRGSFPMKTLEYLAAGRPVVSTPLPAVRWLETDLVAMAGTPDAFAAAVLESAESARRPELVARRRDFASGHTWAQRAESLASMLGLPGVPATSDGVAAGAASGAR
jgi:glycosyltransferase involved in cell wall biosynthesis